MAAFIRLNGCPLQCSFAFCPSLSRAQASLCKRPYAVSELQSRYGSQTLEVELRRIHGLQALWPLEDVRRLVSKDMHMELRWDG